jgi:hypothetical protein
LANRFRDVVAPYYDPFFYVKTVNDYSSSFKNPYWGTYGCQVFWGGGHAGTNDNTVTVAEYGANAITFKRASDPTPWFGTTPNDATANSSGNANAALDFNYMESTIDGQPGSPHSYACGDIIGPEYGGAVHGTLLQVGGAAVNRANDAGAFAAHHMQFDTATLATLAGPNRKWKRVTNNRPGAGWGTSSAPWYTAFVGRHQRVYIATNGMGVPGPVRWFDRVTSTYVAGTGIGFSIDEAAGYDSGVMFWVPQRDLLICAYPLTSGDVKLQWMNVAAGVTQPTVGAPVTLSQTLRVDLPWSAICWCPDNSRLIVIGVSGESGAAYEIEIPASLSSTWTVTRAAFGSGQTMVPADPARGYGVTWKKFQYDEKVRAIVYMPLAATDGDDRVWVYRPRNTG